MKSLIDKINQKGAPASKSWGVGGAFGSWLTTRAHATDYDLRDRKFDLALAYLFLEPVRSPINKYEEAIGNIPIELVRNTTGNPEDDEVIASTADVGQARHPIIEVFRDHRRDFGTGYFSTQVAEFKLYDEVAIELIRPSNRRDRVLARQMKVSNGLKVLRGAALTVDGLGGKIRQFYYNGDDGSLSLDPEDVAYMRGYNPLSDYHGSSDLLSVLDNLNVIRNLRRHALRVLRKAHRPDVFASARDNNLQERDVNNIKRAVHDYRNDDSASMLILSSPLDFETVASPQLSDSVSLSEHEEKTIYRAMRVPMALVGDNSTTTYQQRPGEYAEWVNSDVKPLLNKLLEYNSEQVLPQYDLDKTHRLRANLSAFDVITEDQQARITLQQEHLRTGAMTYADYAKATGIIVPDTLKDCVLIDGIPVPIAEVSNLWRYKFAVPAHLDLAQAEEAQAEAEATEADLPVDDLPAQKNAPEQTTFQSVTYNGITVQASPVRPSSRDDKKFMRYVRYKGDERLIHWGQPGEQMERDNDEARENFNSRHQCDTKKDPFSAGFWACWAWQENAPVRSITIAHGNHKHTFDIETLDYSIDKAIDELKTWVRFRKGNKSRTFEPKYTRGNVADFVLDAIQNDGDVDNAFDEAFGTLYNWQKAIQATRLDFEMDFEELLKRARDPNNNYGRVQWSSAVRSIIRRYGNRAFRDGLLDGGVFEEPSEEDENTIAELIAEQSKYVTALGERIFKTEEGISEALADQKPSMWYNKSISPFYDAGRLSANQNGIYEWVLGRTEKHCDDCPRLDGQRHRLKSYHRKGLVPKSDVLGCQGFNCECKLVPTTGKARGNF